MQAQRLGQWQFKTILESRKAVDIEYQTWQTYKLTTATPQQVSPPRWPNTSRENQPKFQLEKIKVEATLYHEKCKPLVCHHDS